MGTKKDLALREAFKDLAYEPSTNPSMLMKILRTLEKY